MSKFAKLKTLAAVSATVAAMFSAAPAQAYVYAVSYLNVDNLRIDTFKAGTTNIYFAPVGTYNFKQENTATIGNDDPVIKQRNCTGKGVLWLGGGATTTCNITNPVLDAREANATGSTLLRTNNNFTPLGANNTDTYSGADGVLKTSSLIQGSVTSGPVGTSLEAISESLLNINSTASASTLHTSTTSVTYSAALSGGSTDLKVSFDAWTLWKAAIAGLSGDYSSTADIALSFTASHEDGVTSYSFAPGVLNKSAGTTVNPGLDDKSFGSTSFGTTFANMKDGVWTFALQAKTSTFITRAIPEPDSLALLGAALAGLAFATRRRSQKQQQR